MAKSKNKKIGIAICPETPVECIKNYLGSIDQLLIMAVKPGFYGSKFLPETTDKIKQAREINHNLDIEADGGIDLNTIRLAAKAGANMFVSGSYIIKSNDAKKAVEELKICC